MINEGLTESRHLITAQMVTNAALAHLASKLDGTPYQEPACIREYREAREAEWQALGRVGRAKSRAYYVYRTVLEYIGNVWHALKGGSFDD